MAFDPRPYMQSLKGKDYLPVAPRIVMFREAHPTWSIYTEAFEIGKVQLVRATIRDDGDRVIATAHKTVTAFAGGAFEKAETGAIGRALSACGIGTIAALDMDEDDQIADAPIESPRIRLWRRMVEVLGKDDAGALAAPWFRAEFGVEDGRALTETQVGILLSKLDRPTAAEEIRAKAAGGES